MPVFVAGVRIVEFGLSELQTHKGGGVKSTKSSLCLNTEMLLALTTSLDKLSKDGGWCAQDRVNVSAYSEFHAVGPVTEKARHP